MSEDGKPTSFEVEQTGAQNILVSPPPSPILSQIAILSENDLRIKVIMPLFRGLGADPVMDTHGNDEEGKDVYFCYQDISWCDHHSAVFLKAGDINMSGTGSKDMGHITARIIDAVSSPVLSTNTGHVKEEDIQELYFITNGIVPKRARKHLRDFTRSNLGFRNFIIWDGDLLVSKMKKLIDMSSPLIWPDYIFEVATFEDFCNRVVGYKEKIRKFK